ncbi:hypothetical protein JG688_00014520 [Phytophthora aleatoria]|uniref:Uncharacterized protein n=1 Tax=Phytophthora aleatoria TaxID=2496075 RepID=A0A8J5IFV3_9STRA|nr:hypothetical protein JG688_00014520 [Phytophthora aleatoria]
MHLVIRQDKKTIIMDAREERTPGQKRFVVRCYQFMGSKENRAAFGIHRTREHVAKCLGIAHGTVSAVTATYNADNTIAFEESSPMLPCKQVM